MISPPTIPNAIGNHSGQVRHELKYIVPADLLDELRFFAQPFCNPDPAATGHPPEYQVTTLQLDTENRNLHSAKERELLNRFKLRIRTYGEPGTQPEFIEIKRKLELMILKTRIKLSPNTFDKSFVLGTHIPKGIPNGDEQCYWDFVRLVTQLDARPSMLIRYIRESWVGLKDSSQRITFDRALEYSITDQWSFDSPRQWYRMDTATAFQLPFAPLILEMKCSSALPRWMQDLIRFFSLKRTGFCKYSTAMRLESLFEGQSFSDASENTSYW